MEIIKNICELKAPNILYILAISFQLAGALLLICHYMGNTKKQIKDSYFSQDAIVKTENGKVKLRKEKVRTKAAEIYINRIAFGYIAIGYFLGIFGEIEDKSRGLIVFLIAITTFLWMAIGLIVQKKEPNKRFQNDLEIDENELPEGIGKTVTTEDIEKMFQCNK
jgi:hypothetical protein